MERSREAFEKLRKDELSGKVKPYNQIFLGNKFLKDVYSQNIKESKKLVQSFQRNVYHTYNRLQQKYAKRTSSKFKILILM